MWKPNPVMKWTIGVFWFVLFTLTVWTVVGELMRTPSDLSVFAGVTLCAIWFAATFLILFGLVTTFTKKGEK